MQTIHNALSPEALDKVRKLFEGERPAAGGSPELRFTRDAKTADDGSGNRYDRRKAAALARRSSGRVLA